MERAYYSFSLIPSESQAPFWHDKTKNTSVPAPSHYLLLEVYLHLLLTLLLMSLTWDDSISVQEQGDSHQHEDAQGQDVRPPSAPRRAAVVAGWADDGLEQEAQYGANQPHQTVQAARQAHTQKHWCDECCLYCVAEFPSKHDHAMEDKAAPWPPDGLHGPEHSDLPTVHVVLFGASVVCWVRVQRSDVFPRLRDPAGLRPRRLVLW